MKKKKGRNVKISVIVVAVVAATIIGVIIYRRGTERRHRIFLNAGEGISMLSDEDIVSEDYWTLVWSDEFDGTTLNTDDWSYDVGKGEWGWGNNELEYYTKGANLKVEDGNLVITAKYDPDEEERRYTSSRITTKEKVSIRYGRIEARIKLPVGQGIWPAFWMLGNADDFKWPGCGEIDIMEAINQASDCHGYLHWGIKAEDENAPNQSNGYVPQAAGTYTALSMPEEWHTYGIIWNEDEIRWLMDGKVFNTCQFSQEDGSSRTFQEPFYLLLNVAVGGNWPGNPDDNSIFPVSMYVDYVRVYDWKEE